MASCALTASRSNSDTPDTATAFARWKAAHRAIERSNPDDENSESWETIDNAETAILADTSATAEAAERKLWVALAHCGDLSQAHVHAAVTAANPAPLLAMGDALDSNTRLVLGAIDALRTIGARS